jgi:hypothetical protein
MSDVLKLELLPIVVQYTNRIYRKHFYDLALLYDLAATHCLTFTTAQLSISGQAKALPARRQSAFRPRFLSANN